MRESLFPSLPSPQPALLDRGLGHPVIHRTGIELVEALLEQQGPSSRWIAKRVRRQRTLGSRSRPLVREALWTLGRRLGWIRHWLRWSGWGGEGEAELLWWAALIQVGLPVEQALERSGCAPLEVFMALERHQEDWLQREAPAEVELLSVAASLPLAWAAGLLEREGSLQAALSLARSLDQPAELHLRVHPRQDPRRIQQRLTREGIPMRAGRWSPRALRGAGGASLEQHPLYQQGAFEVQDEGSQLMAALVQPTPGERLIDLCAGAGGKSLAVRARHPQQAILALDPRESALREARRRAQRAGFQLRTQSSPASFPPESQSQTLIDAPCTGSGVLRRQPWFRWQPPEQLEARAQLQASLLRQAARWTRPGGRIVYGTCSLLPRENEESVREFLRTHSDWRVVVPSGMQPELLQAWGSGAVLRVDPLRHDTDGFFAVILERPAP